MSLPQSAQADPASLDHLRDIVVPQAVSVWPLAPGWYLVAGLATIALACGVIVAWRRRRARAYRRAGLAELDRLVAAGAAELEALPALVKRVALAAYPRDRVAALSGQRWLEFLDRTGGRAVFTRAPCSRFAEIAYDPKVRDSLDLGARDEILGAVRHWIRRHRVPRRGDGSW